MSIWFKISKLLESLVVGSALSSLFKRLRTPPEKKLRFTITAIGLSSKMTRPHGIVTKSELKVIKKRWQKLVQESHPDNMIAQGLPQEAVNLATSKLIAINQAWEKINQTNVKKILILILQQSINYRPIGHFK